jgi:hypothetical protein
MHIFERPKALAITRGTGTARTAEAIDFDWLFRLVMGK